MKYSKYIFLTVMVVAFLTNQVLADCTTGGAGSSNCSYKKTTTILYMISITTTHSISCGEGMYACCTSDDAFCNTNATPEPNRIIYRMSSDDETVEDIVLAKIILTLIASYHI